MNKLAGIITQLQVSGAVMLVDVRIDEQDFSALLIDSVANQQWIKVGETVNLIFKETEVSLARYLSGSLSTRNRLQCTVTGINRGELLSLVSLQFGQHSIASSVTTRAVDSLQLLVGDNVEALIKATEVSLMYK